MELRTIDSGRSALALIYLSLLQFTPSETILAGLVAAVKPQPVIPLKLVMRERLVLAMEPTLSLLGTQCM